MSFVWCGHHHCVKCGILHRCPTSEHQLSHPPGSCWWKIQADSHTLTILGPASSAVSRHPLPLTPPTSCNAMVVTGLARRPAPSPERMLFDFCTNVGSNDLKGLFNVTGSAIAAGGCALVPCQPHGIIFDLFEAVISHLNSLQINTVPVFFISSVAKSSISYANIFGSWLSHCH